ncbi:GAF sensor signal transduction histidine kinase [Pedobacter westerhofensis]|uniref:histidine kinase n=1 Tax=Pedobacter westerhofensis TaxID=425512 RepID=A0A521FDG5_9SPHI|nr:GAF domain-containing sensor histidine kinase [Pedobacter westerhofensis]SMO93560.1 GAF sensor signal transduction histidine kinase [Pedobacter westerhofensis]
MSNSTLDLHELQRQNALESYHIFDTESEKEFDELASLASTICNVPIALITFIDADRQAFKSHHGTDMTENRRELSFCTHAIASSDEIMIVDDARLDARFSDNPVVTGPAHITFYAGVPLINEDGYALGTICVFDQKANSISQNQISALKTLAKQVIDKLELRRKVRQLEKTNQDLLNSNVLIQKFASMAAHDIKNPLSNILLSSQALKMRHEKQQYEGCLKLIDLSISSTHGLLDLVNEMLEYSKSPTSLLANKQRFSLNSLIKKIKDMLLIPKGIRIKFPDERYEMYTSLIAVDQIILNLLNNAIRYNDKDEGLVEIRFQQDDTHYRFEVEDNGIGIAEEHFEKIFVSNFTLGHTDRTNTKGTGIGLSIVKDLVTALDGTITIKSAVGIGTTFFVSLKK